MYEKAVLRKAGHRWLFGVLWIASCQARSASSNAPAPTFSHDIAPIIYSHCAPCHHPGGIGPFSLLAYEDVRRHRSQIAEVTRKRYMPPWPPEEGFGHFADDRRLSERDLDLISRWVQSGAQEGDAQTTPAVPHYASEWQMGVPDLILRMPQAFTIPANGSDVFRNFVIQTGLKDSRYVRGLELRLDNTRVVHHANVVLDHNGTLRARDGHDGQPGFPGMDVTTEASANRFDPDSHFLFWKPGTAQHLGPESMSWRLDPDTDLVVNLHLQPTGKEEHVRAAIGLYYSQHAPTQFPILVQLENDSAIDIPPGTNSFTISDQITLPVSSELLAIYPHAHYVGKRIEAWAILPDGKRAPLIRISDWDINWQAVYEYQKPLLLPKGTVVHMRVQYDNSAANVRNPHQPPVRVRTGNRSEDEMGHVWLQLLPVPDTKSKSSVESQDQRLLIQEAAMQRRLEKYPGDFLAHYNLGSLLQMRGESQGAIAAYSNALRADPTSVAAHNSLGSALFAADQVDAALAQFEEALRLDPEYLNARYNLARTEAARGDLNASAAAYIALLVRKPDDPVGQAGLGAIYYKQQRFADALACYQRADRLDATDPDVEANLGTLLAISGDLPAAVKAYERALKLNPNHEAAKANLKRAKADMANSR